MNLFAVLYTETAVGVGAEMEAVKVMTAATGADERTAIGAA